MRNLFSLLFSFFVYFNVALLCGQSFGGRNAEWIYDYRGVGSVGITKMKYQKDTLIGNRQIEIFRKIAVRKVGLEDTIEYELKPI